MRKKGCDNSLLIAELRRSWNFPVRRVAHDSLNRAESEKGQQKGEGGNSPCSRIVLSASRNSQTVAKGAVGEEKSLLGEGG